MTVLSTLRELSFNPLSLIGKRITACRIENNTLLLDFEDGTSIDLYDGGQCCCEDRFMTTDDDPASLVGQVLTHLEAKPGPDIEEESGYGDHEQMFIEVATDKGFITLVNHNKHNGYYGGFSLKITDRGDSR